MREWCIAVCALVGCGRIGFGSLAASQEGDDGGHVNADVVAKTVCLVGDACSPCTLTSSQTFGMTAGLGETSLASNGSGYAIAWADYRNSGPDGGEIYFAPFDATGARLAADTRVTTSVGDDGQPSLLWTGSSYVLSEILYTLSTDTVLFSPLSATGTATGTYTISSDSNSNAAAGSSIAVSASGDQIAWRDTAPAGTNYDFYLASVSPTGSVTNIATVAAPDTSPSLPSLAGNGSIFAVGYASATCDDQGNCDSTYSIHVARYDASGTALGDTVVAPAATLYAGYATTDPAIAFQNGGFAIAWIDSGNVQFATLALDGTITSSPKTIAVTGTFSESIVLHARGTGYVVAWQAGSPTSSSTASTVLLDATGTPTSSFIMQVDADQDEHWLSVATSGNDVALAWDDTTVSAVAFNVLACP